MFRRRPASRYRRNRSPRRLARARGSVAVAQTHAPASAEVLDGALPALRTGASGPASLHLASCARCAENRGQCRACRSSANVVRAHRETAPSLSDCPRSSPGSADDFASAFAAIACATGILGKSRLSRDAQVSVSALVSGLTSAKKNQPILLTSGIAYNARSNLTQWGPMGLPMGPLRRS